MSKKDAKQSKEKPAKPDSAKYRLVTFNELPVRHKGGGVGGAWDVLSELFKQRHIVDRDIKDIELHKYVLDGDDAIRGVACCLEVGDGRVVKSWDAPRDIRLWSQMFFPGGADSQSPIAESKETKVLKSSKAESQALVIPAGFAWVEIDALVEWAEQPRTHFDEALIESLAGLMREKGFDDAFPILVRSVGAGRFEVADGHRRLRSAKRAGISHVPIILRELTDAQMLEIAMISGLQHECLSPLEEAMGYRRMLRGGAHTVQTIAKAIGRAESTVKEKLLLCKIAGTPVAEALDAGSVTWSHAVAIARHPSEDARGKLLAMVLKPAYGPGPMPVAELKRQLALHWVRELRGCGWALDDATLVPERRDGDGDRVHGGACDTCPFNALLAHPEQSGGKAKASSAMCMNLACYRDKETAAHQRWVDAEAAKGNKALGADENKQVWNSDGTGLAYNSAYVLADAKPSVADIGAKADADLPAWGKLVEGAEVPVVLAVDGKGKVRTLIKREVAMEAVKLVDAEKPAAKKILAEPKKVKKTDGESKVDALKKKREGELAGYVEAEKIRAVVEAARLPLRDLPIGWPQLAITGLADTLDALGGSRLESIMERRGWEREDEESAFDSVMRKLDAMEGEHFKVELMVEMLMQLSSQTSTSLADWAYLFDVDVKKAGKAAEKAFAAGEAQQAGKEAVIKGVRWITKRKTTADEFQWNDTVCKNEDCAAVDIGKGMIAHITIARVEKGWVYGWSLEIGGALHGEKASRVGAKYGTPELATVSALTALRLEVERKGGTDEQLIKLTDYIKLAQKGAGEK